MILLDIKNLLIDIKDYSIEKADRWIEDNKHQTVYELLVIKKRISQEENEFRDVSCRTSIWHEEEY